MFDLIISPLPKRGCLQKLRFGHGFDTGGVERGAKLTADYNTNHHHQVAVYRQPYGGFMSLAIMTHYFRPAGRRR